MNTIEQLTITDSEVIEA